MHFSKFNRPERLMDPRLAPRGALMVNQYGDLWRIESSIHATSCGDAESRLLTEYSGYGDWGLLCSPEHELLLPEFELLHENPATGTNVAGLDAEGQPLSWEETNRPDYWNNTWEWFTIGSEDHLAAGQVNFPIRAWSIE